MAESRMMLGGGSRGSDGRGTHARFIGETSAGYALVHGLHHVRYDGTGRAAADGLNGEGHAEHGHDGAGQGCDVQQDNDHGTYKVKYCHERNDDRSDSGNALKTAYNDDQGREADDQADHPLGDLDQVAESDRDGVALGQVADAEGSDDREESEGAGQRAAEAPEALSVYRRDTAFHGQHGTAQHLALFIFDPVFDRQGAFRKFGGDTEGRRDPHPDQGAGTAYRQGRRDAGDVAGTDGGCQRCTEGREGRDVSFSPCLPGFPGQCGL